MESAGPRVPAQDAPSPDDPRDSPGKLGRFTCPEPGCGKEFSKNYNLKAHARLHSGEKPFKCAFPGCGKSFMWKSSLRSHDSVHSKTAHPPKKGDARAGAQQQQAPIAVPNLDAVMAAAAAASMSAAGPGLSMQQQILLQQHQQAILVAAQQQMAMVAAAIASGALTTNSPPAVNISPAADQALVHQYADSMTAALAANAQAAAVNQWGSQQPHHNILPAMMSTPPNHTRHTPPRPEDASGARLPTGQSMPQSAAARQQQQPQQQQPAGQEQMQNEAQQHTGAQESEPEDPQAVAVAHDAPDPEVARNISESKQNTSSTLRDIDLDLKTDPSHQMPHFQPHATFNPALLPPQLMGNMVGGNPAVAVAAYANFLNTMAASPQAVFSPSLIPQQSNAAVSQANQPLHSIAAAAAAATPNPWLTSPGVGTSPSAMMHFGGYPMSQPLVHQHPPQPPHPPPAAAQARASRTSKRKLAQISPQTDKNAARES